MSLFFGWVYSISLLFSSSLQCAVKKVDPFGLLGSDKSRVWLTFKPMLGV